MRCLLILVTAGALGADSASLPAFRGPEAALSLIHTVPACFLEQTINVELVNSPIHALLQSLPKIRGVCNRFLPDGGYRPYQTEWSGKRGQAFARALVRINSEIYQGMRRRQPDQRIPHLQKAHRLLTKLLVSPIGIVRSADDRGAVVIRDTLVTIEKVLADSALAGDRDAIKKIHQRIYKLFDLNIVAPVQLLGVPDRPAIGPQAAPMLYAAIEKELERIRKHPKGRKQTCNIILPADRTVESTYQAFVGLLRERPLDLSRVHFFFLDNYLNIPQRYRSRDFRAQALRDVIRPLQQLNDKHPELGFTPGNVHTMYHQDDFFSGQPDDYDPAIARLGGADFALIGIGENSHMAFMEPGSYFTILAQEIRISPTSRKQNAELFDHDYQIVPQFAGSAGIASILGAKEIAQLIATVKKQGAMLRALEYLLSEAFPSASLRTHGKATIIAAADARAKLHPERFAHRYRFADLKIPPTPLAPTPPGYPLGPVQGIIFGWEGTLSHEGALLPGVAAKITKIREDFPDIPMYVLSPVPDSTPIQKTLEDAGIGDQFTAIVVGPTRQAAMDKLMHENYWDEKDLLVVANDADDLSVAPGQRLVGVVHSREEWGRLNPEQLNGTVSDILNIEFQPTFQYNAVNVYIPDREPVFEDDYFIRTEFGLVTGAAILEYLNEFDAFGVLQELKEWLSHHPLEVTPFRIWVSALRAWKKRIDASEHRYRLNVKPRDIFEQDLFARLEKSKKDLLYDLFMEVWTNHFEVPAEDFERYAYFPILLMDLLGQYFPEDPIALTVSGIRLIEAGFESQDFAAQFRAYFAANLESYRELDKQIEGLFKRIVAEAAGDEPVLAAMKQMIREFCAAPKSPSGQPAETPARRPIHEFTVCA